MISFDDGHQTAEILEGEDRGEIVRVKGMPGVFVKHLP